MGEYIRIKGDQIKLGTCDDLRYVTRREAQYLGSQADKDCDYFALAYLLRSPAVWWRFPADEVAAPFTVERIKATAHARELKPHPWCFTVPPEAVDGVEHHDLCHSTGSAFNVNVFIPCPGAVRKGKDRYPLKTSGIPGHIITVGGQGNDGRTVFECYYCGSKWSYQPEHQGEFNLVLLSFLEQFASQGNWTERIAAQFGLRTSDVEAA